MVREALLLVSGLLEEQKTQVVVMPDLPMVYGDRSRLIEMLQNLIDNAAKFMGNQPEPCIQIGAVLEGEETRFFVRDNGIGIEPSFQERIFGLFERLDTTTDGTGIGLAVVKRIVEVHNGRIWAESAGKEKGSTFYFTLPDKP
jgi:signal transduction histidine kinase